VCVQLEDRWPLMHVALGGGGGYRCVISDWVAVVKDEG